MTSRVVALEPLRQYKQRKNVRLILVEDEFPVALEFKQRLARLGYQVLAVLNQGEEAVARARELKPDAMLMDIRLRGQMDGLEAGRRIWRLLGIPSVFITAYAACAPFSRTSESEPFYFLPKPFQDNELSMALDFCLTRAKREIELAEKEERLRLVTSAISDLIWSLDVDLRVRFASPSAQKLLDQSQESLEGRLFLDLLEPGSAGAFLEAVTDHILAKPPPERTCLVRGLGLDYCAGQGVVNTETKVELLRDHKGELTGYAVVSRDLEHRAATRRELRSRREVLATFVEQTPAAIAMLDLNLNYLAVSRRWKKQFGLMGQELVGRSFAQTMPHAPERWIRAFDNGLRGWVQRHREDPLVRQDGQVDWVNWEIQPWRDGQDQVGGIIIFTESVTQALKAREERLHKERLKAAVQTAGAACHEINQPLQTIFMACELCERDLDEDTPWLDGMRRIRAAAARLADINQRLMNLTDFKTVTYHGQTRILDLEGCASPSQELEGPAAVSGLPEPVGTKGAEGA